MNAFYIIFRAISFCVKVRLLAVLLLKDDVLFHKLPQVNLRH